MRAATISDGRIVVADHPDPEPGEGQLLVRMEAAGLNGADLLQLRGRYPPPAGVPVAITGIECAGTVVRTGPSCHHVRGDRVMGLVGGGGHAELVVMEDDLAIEIPDGIQAAEAGGFPEVFTTAHDALFTQCGLAAGDRLLVTGAAGGVGLAAVQLGHEAGAEVVASVHRAELAGRVAELGASRVVAPDDEEGAGPYDVVIELVGAAKLAARLESLSPWGRIAFIGVAGTGSRTELDVTSIMAKRAVLRGSTLRNRSPKERAATAQALRRDVLQLLARRQVHVPVEATFPLEDAPSAYERFAAGGKLGKIVLTPSTPR